LFKPRNLLTFRTYATGNLGAAGWWFLNEFLVGFYGRMVMNYSGNSTLWLWSLKRAGLREKNEEGEP